MLCSIPISKLGARDKLIWGFIENNTFSIKSDYHMDVSRRKRARGEITSRQSDESVGWKKIWDLNVLDVVKPVWKGVNDILRTH